MGGVGNEDAKRVVEANVSVINSVSPLEHESVVLTLGVIRSIWLKLMHIPGLAGRRSYPPTPTTLDCQVL